jgi:hypothetical protein
MSPAGRGVESPDDATTDATEESEAISMKSTIERRRRPCMTIC